MMSSSKSTVVINKTGPAVVVVPRRGLQGLQGNFGPLSSITDVSDLATPGNLFALIGDGTEFKTRLLAMTDITGLVSALSGLGTGQIDLLNQLNALDSDYSAFKTDTNVALALKADTSTMTTALALKADLTALASGLALKADVNHMQALQDGGTGADNRTSVGVWLQNGSSAFSVRLLTAADVATGVFDAGQIPNLDAGKITSGTMDTARLGSGTANSSKYLRGDQSWATLDTSALGDFAISSVADLDLLQYDSASSKWTNRTFLKADLITSKGATVLTLRPGTTGGSDSAAAQIWGGSGASAATGAGVVYYGLNAGGNAGRVVIKPATGTGFTQLFDNAGLEQLRVDVDGMTLKSNATNSSSAYQYYRTSAAWCRNTPTGTTYQDFINGTSYSTLSTNGLGITGQISASNGVFSGATGGLTHLLPGTVAGSDTQGAGIFGGGNSTIARGARVVAYGLDHATLAGKVLLQPATGTGYISIYDSAAAEQVRFDTGGAKWLTTNTVASTEYQIGRNSSYLYAAVPTGVQFAVYVAGTLAFNAGASGISTVSSVYSGNGVFSAAAGVVPQIRPLTADGSDTLSTVLSGGGSNTQSRGAFLQAFGNEHASNAGRIFLFPGDSGSAGYVSIYDRAGAEQIRVDTGGLKFTNGVISATENQVFGYSGGMQYNVATGGRHYVKVNGSILFYVDGNGANSSLYTNGAFGFVVRPNTLVGMDDKILSLSGGGAGQSRGASAYFYGKDNATFPAVLQLKAGAGGVGYVSIFDTTNAEQVRIDVAKLQLIDACDLATGTTTGSKIGVTASQKVGRWGKAPIVQPTTAIAGATRVGGGGAAITDTDTFGGYTLAQIAAILINTGLAA